MRVSGDMDRSSLIDAAAGRIPCDLRIVNCQLVNVITGEIYPAEISVFHRWIASVDTPGKCALPAPRQTIDAENAYIIPGFIDTHVHVESTMMTPSRFAAAVIPWGTTTVVTDPHEIANVMGVSGVLSMAEDAASIPLRHFILAPSCVPANPELETGGAILSPEDIQQLLEQPTVLGLGELMDFGGVCNNAPRMKAELRCGLERDVFLQGHAPRLEGSALASYLCAGIESDHECRSGDECLNKLRLGMHVNLKSTSLSNHLAQALAGIREVPWKDNVSLCTDDVHAQTILTQGHLNRIVKEAIGHGLPPIDAIRFATYNAAREYGFRDLGAVAPGFLADFQIVRELDGGMPEYVFLDGKLAAHQGRCMVSPPAVPSGFDQPPTIRIEPLLAPGAFRLPEQATDGFASVFTLQYKENGGPFHGGRYEMLPVTCGAVDISQDEELCLMCVCNRYGSGEKAIAPMRGSGLRKGAYAFTVSHDSHNLVILYRDARDAFLAAKKVQEMGGGYAAVCDEELIAALALPVGGIMSELPVQQLAEQIHTFEQCSAELFSFPGNLLRFATSSLPVLPGYILTDRGIVDGKNQRILSTNQQDLN